MVGYSQIVCDIVAPAYHTSRSLLQITWFEALLAVTVLSSTMSTNHFGCKINLETSLIFASSMRYVRAVFRNMSSPLVSGEHQISLEIAWYIWSFHASPVNDSTTCKPFMALVVHMVVKYIYLGQYFTCYLVNTVYYSHVSICFYRNRFPYDP